MFEFLKCFSKKFREDRRQSLLAGAKAYIQSTYIEPPPLPPPPKLEPTKDIVRFSISSLANTPKRQNSNQFSDGTRYSISCAEPCKYEGLPSPIFEGFDLLVQQESEALRKHISMKVEPPFITLLYRLMQTYHYKAPEVYRRAGIDRRYYSKIISNRVSPSKDVVIALGLAMRLTMDEFNHFLQTAGFTLSHSLRRDLVVEYCVINKLYKLHEVNLLLADLKLPLLNNK